MVSMCDHIIIYMPPMPPLMRQNALSVAQWLRLLAPVPHPEDAYLPQEWDIEKGIY